jgi:hypothetical protein
MQSAATPWSCSRCWSSWMPLPQPPSTTGSERTPMPIMTCALNRTVVASTNHHTPVPASQHASIPASMHLPHTRSMRHTSYMKFLAQVSHQPIGMARPCSRLYVMRQARGSAVTICSVAAPQAVRPVPRAVLSCAHLEPLCCVNLHGAPGRTSSDQQAQHCGTWQRMLPSLDRTHSALA